MANPDYPEMKQTFAPRPYGPSSSVLHNDGACRARKQKDPLLIITCGQRLRYSALSRKVRCEGREIKKGAALHLFISARPGSNGRVSL
ncbi:hypothetical protein GVI59_07720 [Acetobacter sicerae]|nr:hypothetical protein [Acetobacter sicerae]